MNYHKFYDFPQLFKYASKTLKHKCFYCPWIKTGSAVKQFNRKRIFISLMSNGNEEGHVRFSKRGKENPTEESIPY